MTRYTDLIYNDINKNYAHKLCEYIATNYFNRETLGKKLLDVGCGMGVHIDKFNLLGYNTYGIDIRKENDYSRIRQCDAEHDRFPFDDNTFDYIFSKSFIEHIIRPDNFLNECYRVLKPGGVIVIMTPDWKSQLKFFWDDYSHYHAWTIKSLKDVLSIFGFKNSSCEYFLQLPFIWKHQWLKFIPKIISILPDSFKWKTKDMRNGKDRKLIRFSKEKMLLGVANK